MELPRVYVFCAAVALAFLKVHTSPVGGLLTGFFGGDDPQPKQAPVDINQLLRQYYTAQTEDQLARYNPFGSLNGGIPYGQPQQAYGQLQQGYGQLQQSYGQPQQSYDPYPSPALPYGSNSGYGSPYGSDQYGQLASLYQGNQAQRFSNPAGVSGLGYVNPYGQPLDSLLGSVNQASPYGDLANYRSLDESEAAESEPQSAAAASQVAQARIDASQSNSPVASSLVSSSSSNAASSNAESNQK